MDNLIQPTNQTTRVTIPLSPLKIVKKTIIRMVEFLFIAVFFAFLLGYRTIVPRIYEVYKTPTPLPTPFEIKFTFYGYLFLILLILLIVAALYEYYYYRLYFYDFKEELFVIRKGVIARKEVTIYYNRIQDVYVDQDFLDRVFGLCDVHFATAGQPSALAAHVDGLIQQNAYKLRDLVLSKTKLTHPTVPLSGV